MSEIEMRKITYNPLLNMKYDIPLQKKYSPKLNLFNEIVWVQERVPHQSFLGVPVFDLNKREASISFINYILRICIFRNTKYNTTNNN